MNRTQLLSEVESSNLSQEAKNAITNSCIIADIDSVNHDAEDLKEAFPDLPLDKFMESFQQEMDKRFEGRTTPFGVNARPSEILEQLLKNDFSYEARMFMVVRACIGEH